MAPVIEVLIGLVLVFLILSLVVSALNEGLAGLFGWRSTYLQRGIESLLGAALRGDFYEHQLIRGLRNMHATLPFNRTPSYISASTFTETVVDFVRRTQPPEEQESGEPPAVATEDSVLLDLRERLRAAQIAGHDAPIVREALRIFAAAANNLDEFKTKVDAWFEEAMNRVSGWYKRFSRLMVFLLGLALVVVLNADTINIAVTLWRSAPIRAAVVEQAGKVAGGEQPDVERAQEELARLEELNLPLGWVTGPGRETDPRRLPVDGGEYLLKILGLLLTAVALSFGATFWFDLLKRFVGVRSSGAEPQPAQTGPPSGAAERPERLEITLSPPSGD